MTSSYDAEFRVLSSTDTALRFSPASFARFIGDLLNAARNASSSIAKISVESVRASFPVITSRASNAGSVASLENFTFQGHTSWDVCRYTHFEIALATGRQTLSRPTT